MENKKIRYLILGNPEATCLQGLVNHCLSKMDMQICMLPMSDQTKARYVSDIQVIPISKSLYEERNTSFLKKIKYRILLVKQILSGEKYDIINLQYVEALWLLMAFVMKRKSNCIVSSFWGSDLFQQSIFQNLVLKILINKVQFVTFDSQGLNDDFYKKYAYFNGSGRNALFGADVIDAVKNLNADDVSVEDCKAHFGIPEDMIAIAIGHNAREEHQHMAVIDAIANLPEQWKQKICLLLQMTYGGSDEYIQRVGSYAESKALKTMIITEYMDIAEVARLRKATDIYINSQVTDAFSISVCENLYAKTKLVNASWLNYEELDIYGLEYVSYTDFCALTKTLLAVLEDDKLINVEKNQDIMWELRSWEAAEKTWNDIIHKAINIVNIDNDSEMKK